MFTVYKASAGSGKTFRLVIEYLRQIILNEKAYRHILAVTFTNKATAEMKERIVSQLYQISHKTEENPYARIISNETGLKPEEIRERAGKALRHILHDYNHFSVSTIDKFTQKVIRSFNRELGLTPGYILELDNKMILQEATDRLILKAGNDKDLLQWLTLLGEKRMQEDKSILIHQTIVTLGEELFKEKFQHSFMEVNSDLYNHQNLKNYRNELQKIIRSFEAVLKEKGKKGWQILKDNDLQPDEFKGKSRSVAHTFEKLLQANYTFGTTIEKACSDVNEWITPRHSPTLKQLVSEQLMPLLNESMTFYEQGKTNYNTATLILDNLYTLGLLNDLQKELEALCREKEIIPLSDANLLLKKIIHGSDTPFIYEKTGNWYHHYMLDEFQDTSTMQWENFKPLIDNSLAEGHQNFAVGDVKQSIYRWRNSDWKILHSEVEAQIHKEQLQTVTMQHNWRSDGRIIHFNNLLFPELIRQVTQILEHERKLDEASRRIQKMYHDIIQFPAKMDGKEQGLVRMRFSETNGKEDFHQQSLHWLLQQVKAFQDAGMAARDIAILVRRNSDGSEIIRYFLEKAGRPENSSYNLEIISNESLFLRASKSVTFLIQLITHLVDPEDKLTKANILNEYNLYIGPELAALGKNPLHHATAKPENPEEDIYNGESQLDSSYEEQFDILLAPQIAILRTQILNASIDEAITLLCHHFNLFELRDELPFLMGLIDQAAQIRYTLSNDLSGFLKWWDDIGFQAKVHVNEDTDALTVLTIHKAKGLEFKGVLIPFADWEITLSRNVPMLWCIPNRKPFNQLPLVPVQAVKKMEHTIFSPDYAEETTNTYIDNLNLIYVAFTRPIHAICLHAPLEINRGRSINNVNTLLYESLLKIVEEKQWPGTYNPEISEFTYGTWPENISLKEPTKQRLIPEKYHFSAFNTRLKLRTDSEDFFPETALSDKNLGKILHEILAVVEYETDVEKACMQALKLQRINRNEYTLLLRWLNERVRSPQTKQWFSTEYRILNERDLLSPECVRRPDRILIKDNKAVVIDYKLGHAMPDTYDRQVANYAGILKKTGFEKVEGYLWFLLPNRVKQIC
jgi:ATP-dependent helicase/nuclease subunit A